MRDRRGRFDRREFLSQAGLGGALLAAGASLGTPQAAGAAPRANETDFEAPGLPPGVEWEIDLGTVHETAEVTLNGALLGAAWKGLRRVACGPALRAGRNHLKIEVANLWIHEMAQRTAPDLTPLEETYGVRWGRYGEVRPDAIPPAGLLGPVRLLPLRRVSVRL